MLATWTWLSEKIFEILTFLSNKSHCKYHRQNLSHLIPRPLIYNALSCVGKIWLLPHEVDWWNAICTFGTLSISGIPLVTHVYINQTGNHVFSLWPLACLVKINYLCLKIMITCSEFIISGAFVVWFQSKYIRKCALMKMQFNIYCKNIWLKSQCLIDLISYACFSKTSLVVTWAEISEQEGRMRSYYVHLNGNVLSRTQCSHHCLFISYLNIVMDRSWQTANSSRISILDIRL